MVSNRSKYFKHHSVNLKQCKKMGNHRTSLTEIQFAIEEKFWQDLKDIKYHDEIAIFVDVYIKYIFILNLQGMRNMDK